MTLCEIALPCRQRMPIPKGHSNHVVVPFPLELHWAFTNCDWACFVEKSECFLLRVATDIDAFL
jgi:hypothetical protein